MYMLTVLGVNKVGNRIESYTVTDGKATFEETKTRLINYIRNHQVTNATVQVYNGNVIVRIKDTVPVSTMTYGEREEKVSDITNRSGMGIGSLTVFDYILKARESGLKTLSLDGIVVDTSTGTIIQAKSKQDATKEERTTPSNRISSEAYGAYTSISSESKRYGRRTLGVILLEMQIIYDMLHKGVAIENSTGIEITWADEAQYYYDYRGYNGYDTGIINSAELCQKYNKLTTPEQDIKEITKVVLHLNEIDDADLVMTYRHKLYIFSINVDGRSVSGGPQLAALKAEGFPVELLSEYFATVEEFAKRFSKYRNRA